MHICNYMIVSIDDNFNDIGKSYINRTIEIFEKIEFANDSEDWKWIKIDGSVFGSDTANYNYWVHYFKDGFSVQFCSKRDTNQTCYMFQIVFYVENNLKKAHVCHHGHGPFTVFGFEYEK